MENTSLNKIKLWVKKFVWLSFCCFVWMFRYYNATRTHEFGCYMYFNQPISLLVITCLPFTSVKLLEMFA